MKLARPCVLALLGGGLAAACGHLPMDELPLEADELRGDSGPAGLDASGDATGDGAVERDSSGDDDSGRRDGGNFVDGGKPIDAGCTDLSCGVFVDLRAPNDNGLGTRTDPVRSIQTGIKRAQDAKRGKLTVYIAGGRYKEKPVLADGISLSGGWDCPDDIAKACAEPATVVEAIDDQGFLVGKDISEKTTVQRLHFETGTIPNGDRTAMTIQGGSPILRAVEIGFVLTASLPGAMSSKSTALRVVGNARPRLEECTIRSAPAIDESVGVVLINDAASAAVPTIAMKGGSIDSGVAKLSVGLRVGPGASGNVSSSSTVDNVDITGLTWGVDALGPVQLQSNRINLVRSPTLVNTMAAACTIGGDPCGGGVRARSGVLLSGNYIGGAGLIWSAAVYLTPESTGPVMRVNGNTIHGGGLEPATLPPVANNSISAAIVVQAKNQSIKTGEVLNNILMGGVNENRYGVYERLPASNQTTKYTAWLKQFTNNDFAGVFTAAYKHSPDGVNYALPTTPMDVRSQVTSPQVGEVFAVEPKFLADQYHLDPALNPGLIDKGTTHETQLMDIDGKPRALVGGGKVDIGADEVK